MDIIKRLWSGPLFTEMIDRMDEIVKGNYKGKEKLHAYSGHDGSIAGLLAILGIFPDVFPTYANALLLELHQRRPPKARGNRGEVRTEESGGEPFVRLFHKNGTEANALFELQIPNCGSPCTVKKLRETHKAFLIGTTQWRRECDGQTEKGKATETETNRQTVKE